MGLSNKQRVSTIKNNALKLIIMKTLSKLWDCISQFLFGNQQNLFKP